MFPKKFRKYFGKKNPKIIFKGDKTVFYESEGVEEEICRGAGRSCLDFISGLPSLKSMGYSA